MSGDRFDKERFDALLELSKHHRERINTRRSYQWKVNLALWAGLGATAGIVATRGVELGSCGGWKWIITGILVAIAIVYVCPWTKGLTKRNLYDSKLAEGFARMAESLACRERKELLDALPSVGGGAGEQQTCTPVTDWARRNSPNHWWKGWSSASEVIFTLCMVGLVIVALMGAFKPKGNAEKMNQCGPAATHAAGAGPAH